MILSERNDFEAEKSVKIRAHPWLKNIIRWEQNCLNPFCYCLRLVRVEPQINSSLASD